MRPVVFLGPSCGRDRAERILPADYRPPARRGDVEAAAGAGARVIVLIDGYIIHAYPPSPMEVHSALATGVRVFGAASLGALRAVELRHHRMQGIGWVYQRYLDESIWADDEVVTAVDPLTGGTSSVPLVRIRYALESLVPSGTVSAGQRDLLIARLRGTPYDERTEALVRVASQQSGLSQQAIERLLSPRFDVKRLDTEACLTTVARRPRGASPS